MQADSLAATQQFQPIMNSHDSHRVEDACCESVSIVPRDQYLWKIEGMRRMERREEILEDRIRRGDASALGEWLQSRRPHLLAFIERKTGPALRRKLEPEDILQEVAAECVRAISKVDFQQRDPFGWLCQTAERRIIDAYRKFFGAQKRAADREIPLDAQAGGTNRVGMIDLLAASMTTPSQAFSRNQREFKLHEAMDTLSDESREAIRLRYVEKLPTKEIAQLLDKTDGAVRVLLTRSLKRLAQQIGSDGLPS